ncbi:MAG: ECF transporter S component [Treponemataceae bacterium]
MYISKQKLTIKIAITAGLSALIIVMGLTHIGFIPWFSGASITIIQIPVILAAMLCGWTSSFVSGLIFGIFSLIIAATSPTGPIDAFFVNPLISVLPRALMGLATGWIFIGLSKIPKFPEQINYGITGFIGSLINSVFVLGALCIAKAIELKIALTVISVNGLLEATVSAIICIAVMSVLSIPKNKSKFSDKSDEEKNDTFLDSHTDNEIGKNK